MNKVILSLVLALTLVGVAGIVPAQASDLSALELKIEEALTLIDITDTGLAPGQYPQSFEDVLLAELNNASSIDDTMDQEVVDSAVDLLDQAITAFKDSVIGPSDRTAYKAALAAVVEADYTAESWAAYQLVVADNVVTENDSQDDVDTATANIVTAQGGLVEKPIIEPIPDPEPQKISSGGGGGGSRRVKPAAAPGQVLGASTVNWSLLSLQERQAILAQLMKQLQEIIRLFEAYKASLA